MIHLPDFTNDPELPLVSVFSAIVYLKNAGRVSQVRVVESAYRLAEFWKDCVKNEE
jgi:hypothetical protein